MLLCSIEHSLVDGVAAAVAGTFISMDILTRRLADVGTIDVQRTVERIRSQRAFSIQMPDQYVFIHLALLEHAQREGVVEHLNLAGFDDSNSESD